MWIFEGNNVSEPLIEWAEKFKKHINSNYETEPRKQKSVFKRALNSFAQKYFVHHEDQDRFVRSVGVNECVTWASNSDDWQDIKDGLGFVCTILESVFSQIFYFQQEETENESYIPRTRKYRPLIESALRKLKRSQQ